MEPASGGDASDIDGQTAGRYGREHMSQCGQRASFNRDRMEPDGISDIEGKVARVATSKLDNERVSISRCHRQARWTGQPAGANALACKTDGRDPRSQTRGVEDGKAVASA